MNRIKEILGRQQVWGFFVSVVVMAVLAVAFFYPDNFDGNSLQHPDMAQGHRRESSVDRRSFRRHAHLPDFAVISV